MILAIRCKDYNQVEAFLKQVRETYKDLDIRYGVDIFLQEIDEQELLHKEITPLPEDTLEYRVLVTLYYAHRL